VKIWEAVARVQNPVERRKKQFLVFAWFACPTREGDGKLEIDPSVLQSIWGEIPISLPRPESLDRGSGPAPFAAPPKEPAMPIDPLAGDLLTLAQAARLFPPRRRESRLATSTLWRWATRGLRGTRLDVVKVGGVTYTTGYMVGGLLVMPVSHRYPAGYQVLGPQGTGRTLPVVTSMPSSNLPSSAATIGPFTLGWTSSPPAPR
jgi:hypothetical protein